MPSYGLLTDPSHEILSEIGKIHDLEFDYVEIGIEGPEGNPTLIYNTQGMKYQSWFKVSSKKL